MKKFLIKLLIFFSFIFVIDTSVGYVGDYLQSHANGGDTRKTNDLVMIDKHDILIFGSSRARHHYDTPYLSDSLKLDVYNAGYDGNGIILTYGLLSIMLERYQPKLILLDIEPSFDIEEYTGDNNHKRYITLLKPYYQHEGAEEVIKSVSTEEWYKAQFGMMRYNTSILSNVIDYFFSSVPRNKGFEPVYQEYTGELSDGGSKPLKLDSFKLNYVDKTILLAKSKNVPIIVVASPKYRNTLYNELEPIVDICIKYDVPFIDYYANEEFLQHKEWFKDPMHLNADGARVFSTQIIGDIQKYIF